jgi:propionyl-CoA synthetase
MARCCTAPPATLYEGKPVGTPDAGAFWRVAQSSTGFPSLFTAPTAFRAIKREDPDGKLVKKYDLSKFPRAVPRRANAPIPTP